jgi:hypothetical protein
MTSVPQAARYQVRALTHALRRAIGAPGNDELGVSADRFLLRRHNRPLDLAETDAMAVALTPAVETQRIAVL